jgi:hypothetical protein
MEWFSISLHVAPFLRECDLALALCFFAYNLAQSFTAVFSMSGAYEQSEGA